MIRQKNTGSPQTKPSLSKIDWESREVWLGQPIRKTPSCLWWWMWILCINQPGCPGILSNLILDFCEDVSQRDQYLNLWAVKQSLLPDAVGLSNQLKTWKEQKAGLQQVKGDFLCWLVSAPLSAVPCSSPFRALGSLWVNPIDWELEQMLAKIISSVWVFIGRMIFLELFIYALILQ